MTSSLLLPLQVSAPKLECSLLAPLIIVLVGACVGVLLEAFVPRHRRRDAQTVIAGLSMLLALVSVLITWGSGTRQVAALGSVVIDGPTLAAWSGLLVFGGMALVLFAERRVGAGQSAFTPMAAAMPGTPLERRASLARSEHTELFP